MPYTERHARDKGRLLPASVEDHVPVDNPVRFTVAFIDDLDRGEAVRRRRIDRRDQTARI